MGPFIFFETHLNIATFIITQIRRGFHELISTSTSVRDESPKMIKYRFWGTSGKDFLLELCPKTEPDGLNMYLLHFETFESPLMSSRIYEWGV